MKKIILLAAISFSLFTKLGYAESHNCPPAAARPSQAALTEAAKQAKDHGFLWKISKGDQVSYLYGTIHIAKFEDMFPGPATKQAMVAADTIALEIDVLGAGVQQQLMQGMATTKSFELPEQLTARIKRAAAAQCVPYEGIASMMPEMQVVTIQLLVPRADGLYGDYGIDMMLSGFGHAAGKEVVSLETPEMQINMLRMSTQHETIAFVEKNLSQLESGEARKLMQRMYQDWASSNRTDMARYKEWCQCLDSASDKQFMEKMLDNRNITMAEHIDQLHTAGETVFAAVGSLHLFGEKGLPELMRQRGYQVDAVVFQ